MSAACRDSEMPPTFPSLVARASASLGSVRVTPLRTCVEVDVRTEPERESRPPGQQPRCEVEGDALEMVTQQAAEADVHAGHERERRQEVLAELAVGDPRSTGRGALERE